ncbi:MAG: L-threo-3-hydroxyaspartate ammonia-lyase, partial [uncultured Solirubrobacteraceae bacterium]
ADHLLRQPRAGRRARRPPARHHRGGAHARGRARQQTCGDRGLRCRGRHVRPLHHRPRGTDRAGRRGTRAPRAARLRRPARDRGPGDRRARAARGRGRPRRAARLPRRRWPHRRLLADRQGAQPEPRRRRRRAGRAAGGAARARGGRAGQGAGGANDRRRAADRLDRAPQPRAHRRARRHGRRGPRRRDRRRDDVPLRAREDRGRAQRGERAGGAAQRSGRRGGQAGRRDAQRRQRRRSAVRVARQSRGTL